MLWSQSGTGGANMTYAIISMVTLGMIGVLTGARMLFEK